MHQFHSHLLMIVRKEKKRKWVELFKANWSQIFLQSSLKSGIIFLKLNSAHFFSHSMKSHRLETRLKMYTLFPQIIYLRVFLTASYEVSQS